MRRASRNKSPSDTFIVILEATRLQDSNLVVEATNCGILLRHPHQTSTTGVVQRGEERWCGTQVTVKNLGFAHFHPFRLLDARDWSLGLLALQRTGH